MVCPLFGGLSSFGVSFIRGFTVYLRTYTDEVLSWQLEEGVQLFHRPKREEFEHYTHLQRQQINLQIHSTSVHLQKATGSSYRLEEYLWNRSR